MHVRNFRRSCCNLAPIFSTADLCQIFCDSAVQEEEVCTRDVVQYLCRDK
ncbi:hypothetical protein AAZX31_06G278900 [Glycine max]